MPAIELREVFQDPSGSGPPALDGGEPERARKARTRAAWQQWLREDHGAQAVNGLVAPTRGRSSLGDDVVDGGPGRACGVASATSSRRRAASPLERGGERGARPAAARLGARSARRSGARAAGAGRADLPTASRPAAGASSRAGSASAWAWRARSRRPAAAADGRALRRARPADAPRASRRSSARCSSGWARRCSS